MRWLETRVTVGAEAAEAVGGRLLRLGARGFRTEESPEGVVLTAHFPRRGAEADLRTFLAGLPALGLDPSPARVETRLVDDSTWWGPQEAFLRPLRVGRRLVVVLSPESTAGAGAEDLLVAIDPRLAFGTGHHPTTRGALELLEAGFGAAGWRPRLGLDLGTGTGILAVAAAKLGVPEVLAVDDDPPAVEAAKENAVRNQVADRVRVVSGDLAGLLSADSPDRVGRPADLVTANLTTEQIRAIVPSVARVLAPGGLFVAAGVSSGEGEEEVGRAAREAGLTPAGRRAEEGWSSLAFRKPPRALFYTLGCKVNLCDTAEMMSLLRAAGWEVLSRGEETTGQAWPQQEAPGAAGDSRVPAGDPGRGTEGPGLPVALCVVNSCAVTARAEAKSRQMVRKLRREHPGALLVLAGCYPELRRDEAAALPGVDVVLGTRDRRELPVILEERGLPAARPGSGLPTAGPVSALPGGGSEGGLPGGPAAFAGERTRATVKVQDGCDQFCAYCVIPHARGRSRSRSLDEVLEEIAGLVENGFKEIVLAGIHLGAWCDGDRSLTDLVAAVAAVPGLARVRLSSIEPLEVTSELLDLVTSNPRVCRHLHVPLQSGSDRILERMNRRYTAAQYLALALELRRRAPLAALTTDVMVGFPGETEADFAETVRVVRTAGFSRLHVFRFSPRPGTPAAGMPGQVDEDKKTRRGRDLIRVGKALNRRFRESLVGRTLDVLVEAAGPAAVDAASPTAGEAPGETAGEITGEGLSDNYVRVSVTGRGVRQNEIVPVLIEGLTLDGLAGREVRGGCRPPAPA